MANEPEQVDIRSCGFLIVRYQPRRTFLLMKHSDRWDLPKGNMDPGETEIQCALRELHEETGILPEAIDIDPQFRFIHRYRIKASKPHPGSKLKELVIFLGQLTRDVKIRVSEHEGYRWFDWAPPHRIQKRTIDSLLAAVPQHWGGTLISKS